MSYKISYGSSAEKRTAKQGSQRWLAGVAVLVIILAGIARYYYPEETKQLSEALFPLTSESSQRALKAFSENIRAGESVGDAVTAFCQEIIHESDVS